MENSVVTVINGQLSYIMRDANFVPVHLVPSHGSEVVRLDLSDNCLRSLAGLELFPRLEEVILDCNGLTDSMIGTLPDLPKVHTLSLNKNKLKDLDHLLRLIQTHLPSLTYLSLLGNEACPNQLSCQDNDDDDYRRYRLYVLYKLPQLCFLDSTALKDSERVEARQKGAYYGVVRPSEDVILRDSATADQDACEYRPLPQTVGDELETKAKFGKCRYIYYGRHSEGNRFIRNNDL